MKHIAALRKSYSRETLNETDVAQLPFEQFSKWFQEALQSELPEPNAMTIATVSAAGRPSARTVLLKGFDHNGLVFFTNYESRKGQEINANPFGTILFCWLELERQIRIEGVIEKIDRKDSLDYFISRPKESQIGAWASPQSQVIPDRSILEERQSSLGQQYAESTNLPLPENWGGYRLIPDYFEFWQGRESRLHDRIFYQLINQEWKIGRLAP